MEDGGAADADAVSEGAAAAPDLLPVTASPPPAAATAVRIAAAYDAIAGDYDDLVREDSWMRRRLWAHHRRAFAPGGRILDVACGTGLDTLHLAAAGFSMTAVDVSPGMLAELRHKAAARGIASRIDSFVGDAAQLAAVLPRGVVFAGILSSFAGLNTIDLPAFAAAAAGLLRPGGRAILHLLAPPLSVRPAAVGPPAADPTAGDPAAAALGTRGGAAAEPVRIVEIRGIPLPHALPAPLDLYRRHFATQFRLCACYGMGWLLRRGAGRRVPRPWLALLGRLDVGFGRLPSLRRRSRFVVLDLERRPAAASPV